MRRFNSPWKTAEVMGQCLFGHSGDTKLRWQFEYKSIQKPTHTDLYLQWDIHHTIAAKYSGVNTLHHRAKAVCSNQQLLKDEEEYLQKFLTESKCPTWALNRVKMKTKEPSRQELKRRDITNANNTTDNKKPYTVLPYAKGLSESMKNICNKHGV